MVKSVVGESAHRALDELADEGLLEKKTTDERYVLTLTGRLLADTVILRLLT